MTKQTPTVKPDTKPTKASKTGSVDAFVAALGSAPKPGSSGRLLFALDATLSRERTWDRAMHIQSAMFQEANTVNGLAMKLIYFRGFNECRASGWQTDGNSLARLMQGIGCLGGQTQIGRVLSFARKEIAKAPVPALVYIGDAVEEDADALSQMAGELGLLGCKLFMFHEGTDRFAGSVFRSMANNSGGGYFQFDERSAETLARLLQAVARYASGGRAALESAQSREGRLLLEQMR
ncbi:MAG: VWA domain-containing protein [Rhizobiales bacterium]|nr:VWA domain-containing protein [Hyphomicrobiales bacterium]MBO6698109.1 VWA domain-containing protein [Hyphomicrobiales bacterium]MBO6735637.1 VWA domain-containing protein [Hyphomicrobiales bacterium]MBO6910555.1 VWA domain-containing protein [Hyphomicrobiales bacterium]MBO6956095.1 VWA domain-containing protein [Hyphomicrobiales bacterium]